MANYKIEDIEGIGPAYGEKLREAGVTDTDGLLAACKTPAQRKALAEKTEIGEKLLLEWANHADLYRIKGIGSEYADLLEEAGVDTVPELAQRNAENLAAKLVEVNDAKNLVRSVPSAAEVAGWVEQASGMERALEY
jgi:predicted flap endonuclease-1-like 5' DNA nuclease